MVVEGFFKANAVNEGDAERDCVQEEQESFKANAVNEGDAVAFMSAFPARHWCLVVALVEHLQRHDLHLSSALSSLRSA